MDGFHCTMLVCKFMYQTDALKLFTLEDDSKTILHVRTNKICIIRSPIHDCIINFSIVGFELSVHGFVRGYVHRDQEISHTKPKFSLKFKSWWTGMSIPRTQLTDCDHSTF